MEAKRPPRRPKERLASLKGPRGAVKRRPPRVTPKTQCPNPQCTTPDVQEVDGSLACLSCGTMVSETNIVSEVTFGESSTGAAVVQGGFVGEGQRHAKSLGTAFRRAGGMESREATEQNGRDEIRKQANALSLNEHISDQAFGIYKLACANNFIQGRRFRMIAAVCLYAACRRDDRNQTLLMDFSELIQVNVFRLGQIYQDLKKDLWLDSLDASGIRPVIEVENLIMKFARKLEFGSSLMRVAEDAAKIVKRMDRDWMVTGRQPAGLCGACIILAARMNNFRRTVREVVYIVKVADMTVAKRLEEFKRTRSSDLTVDQFREIGLRLRVEHDPPAVYQRMERDEKRKRKLVRMITGGHEDDPETISDDESRAPSERGLVAPASALRRDADGFAIPEIPVDPSFRNFQDNGEPSSSTADTMSSPSAGISDSDKPPAKKKPKSRKKPLKPPPMKLTAEELLDEIELEDEIEEVLSDPNALSTMEETVFEEFQARAKALADSLRGKSNPAPPVNAISNDQNIDEEEFEDDPEVANCLLSEAERKIKERIWVTYNEDWLRSQQAKALKKALDEANGTTKKLKRKRPKGRMGDGSVLEGGTPVQSPADANQRMLQKRSKGFSKHINYEKLNEIYRGIMGTSSSGGTDAATVTDSDAGTEANEAVVAGSEEPRELVVSSPSNQVPLELLPTPAATQEVSSAESESGAPAEADVTGNVEAVGQPAEETEVADEEEEDEEDEEDENGDERAVMHNFGIDDGEYDEDENAGFGEEDLD